MRGHRILPAALLAAAVAAIIAGWVLPAAAGTRPRDGDRDRRIAVGGTAVAADEIIDGPLISIDGRARIAGRVDGSAVVVRGDLVLTENATIDDNVFVVRGDARIDGVVGGNVTVVGGRAIVADGAVVRGDVRSSDKPRIAGSARVRGDVEDVNLTGIVTAIGVGLLVFWWIAVTVSTAILGAVLIAVFPRALDAAVAAGRDRRDWWRAALTGLALVIGVPFVGVIALTTIVGLPMGLGLLGAIGLMHAVGYVTSAYFLGRLLVRPPKNRFGAFFAGWGILRAAAVIPGLGVLVWFAAAIFGIGMLAVVALRAGRTGDQPDHETDASPAPVAAD